MERISPAGNRLATCANTGRGKEVWSGETRSSLHGAIHQREVVVRGPRERGRWWMRLLGADGERRRLCKRGHLASCGLHACLGHEGLRMEHREWSAAAATKSTWRALGRLATHSALPTARCAEQRKECPAGLGGGLLWPIGGSAMAMHSKSSRPGSPDALGRSVALRFCWSCAACA